ncbi:MAG TPA: AAA family ATPase, partial [Chthoniobacterales bacterium]|nr:AAA family ATPase [Chthoniobacterales bacterium]
MPIILTHLRIKNLALVEDLEWQLESGFTAITGETGAGKSIIIGALQLLLGERTDKSLIRTGADACSVEALFTGNDLEKLNRQLSDIGVEPSDGELIAKRSFSAMGANRQFINGSAVTLAALKKLGDELVDLHGPHDHQSLLSPDRQLALLDGFAHAHDVVREFEKRYRQLQALVSEESSLSTAESARGQEIDLLRHQVAEIENAKLSAAEEEEINARYKLASNSKRLMELAGTISRRLSDAEDSILAQLAETQRLLRELEKIDPTQRILAESHEASVIELSEISRSISRYAEQLEIDSEQVALLEERISLFETLKRKYGRSIADVIASGEQATERLRKIEGRDQELDRLRKEIGTTRADVEHSGQALRKLRTKAAPKLSERIRSNLRELGFRQSNFEAKLSTLDEPRPNGFDTIELLFSPNPGEP